MSEPGPTSAVDHVTERWAGFAALAVLFAGLGALQRLPGFVLAGLVCLAYAGYAETARPAALRTDDERSALAIDRRIEPVAPDPGEDVTVTVEVRNEGSAFLPDVRIVDGVPPELAVTEGSPRHGAALAAGDGTAFSYVVTATRGEYDWRPAQVTVADPSGGVERETAIAASTTLRCSLPALETDRLPLRGVTSQYAGRIETDSGGPGVEFYSTREYRPNDPLSRIDWHRLAKTGELSTVEFREEHAAKVMLVVDARKAAYLAPGPDDAHAVERSVDAAYRVFAALLEGGDRVGVTTIGRLGEDPWLPARTGDEHRARGRELLNSHPALSPIPPERELFEPYREDRRADLRREYADRLHRRLSPDTQVLLFSPFCDEYPITLARRLDGYGHLVTAVSPDPTVTDPPLEELARMERADRLRALRHSGIRVIDWGADERFVATLASAEARWSQ